MNRTNRNHQYALRKTHFGVGSVVVGVLLAGLLQAPAVLASETTTAASETGIVAESEASRNLREKIAELTSLKDQLQDAAERSTVEQAIVNAQGALETGQDTVINAYLNHLSSVISHARQVVAAQAPLTNTEVREAAPVEPSHETETIESRSTSEELNAPVNEISENQPDSTRFRSAADQGGSETPQSLGEPVLLEFSTEGLTLSADDPTAYEDANYRGLQNLINGDLGDGNFVLTELKWGTSKQLPQTVHFTFHEPTALEHFVLHKRINNNGTLTKYRVAIQKEDDSLVTSEDIAVAFTELNPEFSLKEFGRLKKVSITFLEAYSGRSEEAARLNLHELTLRGISFFKTSNIVGKQVASDRLRIEASREDYETSPQRGPENLLDGNYSSLAELEWDGSKHLPQTLTLHLQDGQTSNLTGFVLYKRPSSNGSVTEYSLKTYNGDTLVESFENVAVDFKANLSSIALNGSPVTKLVVVVQKAKSSNGQEVNHQMTLRELKLFEADPIEENRPDSTTEPGSADENGGESSSDGTGVSNTEGGLSDSNGEHTGEETPPVEDFPNLPVPENYLIERNLQGLADRKVIHKSDADFTEDGTYTFSADELGILKNLDQGVLHLDVKVDHIEAGQQLDVFKLYTDDNNFFRIFAFIDGNNLEFGMEGKKDGNTYLNNAYKNTVLHTQLGKWSSITYLKTGNRTRFFVNGRNSTTQPILQNADKLILASDTSTVVYGSTDTSKGQLTLGDLTVYNNPNVVSDTSGVTDNPLSLRYFRNYPSQAQQPLTIARVAHAGEGKDNFVEVFFNRSVAAIGQPDLALGNGSYVKFIRQTGSNSILYQVKDADYGVRITGLRAKEGDHSLYNSSFGPVHLDGIVPRLEKVSIDDNNTNLVYTGSWTSEAGDGKFNRTGRYTSGNGPRAVTLYFEGTGVDMYAERHNAHADLLVELDGEAIDYNEQLGLGRDGKFSLYIPADQTRQRQERIFTLDQLQAGKHALTLSVDPANADKQLYLDVFDLFGENARVLTKDEYFSDLVAEKERLVGLAADSSKVTDAEVFATKRTAFETELAKAVPSISVVKQALAEMAALIVEENQDTPGSTEGGESGSGDSSTPAPTEGGSEEISAAEARRLLAEYTDELAGYLARLDASSQEWVDYLTEFNAYSRALLAEMDNDAEVIEQYKEAKTNVDMFRGLVNGGATDQPGSGDNTSPGSTEGGESGSGETPTPAPTEGGESGSGETPTPGSTEGSESGSGETPTPGSTEGSESGSGETPTPGATEGGESGSGETPTPAPTEGDESGTTTDQPGQGSGLDLAALEEVIATALALEEENLSETQAGQLAELLETAAAARTAESQDQVDEVVALFEEWLSGLDAPEESTSPGSSESTGSQPGSGSSESTGSQPGSGSSESTGSQPGSGTSDGTGSQPGSGTSESTSNQDGSASSDSQSGNENSGTAAERPSLDATSVVRLREIVSELEGYIPRLAGEEWPAYLNQFRDLANRILTSGTPTQLATHLAEGEELIELLRGVFAEAEQGNQSADVTEKGKGLLNEGPKAFEVGLILNENLTHELPAFDGGLSLNENLMHEVPSFEGGLTLNENLTHQVPTFDGSLVPNYAPTLQLPSLNPASLKPAAAAKVVQKEDKTDVILPNTAGAEGLLLTGMGLMTLGAAVALRRRKEK
ncbi:YSIRK-type signal peptide-containing protein [Streptococcus suis]|nr:YSIRK-type signal peptide-containing protein [Streptococcus suis]